MSLQLSSRSRRLLSTALPVVAAFSLTSSLLDAQLQQITFSAPLSAEIIDHQVEAGPEIDWNCLDIGTGETIFRAIMPNYRSGDPETIAALKITERKLMKEGFLTIGGSVGTLRNNGDVVALEWDIFEGINPGTPPDSSFAIAELRGTNAQGTNIHLGTLYGFDDQEFQDRKDDLQAAMGGNPLSQYTVFNGNTFQSNDTGISMRIQGTNNMLYGSVHGNDQVRLGGQNWTVTGTIYHVGMYLVFGSGHQIGAVSGAGSQSLPIPASSLSSYQSQAAAAGNSYSGDLIIYSDGNGNAVDAQNRILVGVVYASGNISVDGSNIVSSLTLVAGGSVDVNGGSNQLTAAKDDLLFWSVSTTAGDAISVDGSGNLLTGAVYAPAVEFRVGGSSNQMHGRYQAGTVKVTGGSNVFTDGTE